ncbi:MAG: neutral zinc metallopeptidase [Acidobacteria bacterium]|jgi:predicted metalloprotease|nr:neutral zinc metallopeptidase [Acidobacteriota bacterium]
MRDSFRLIAAASAAALALTVAGCGSSDSASSPDAAADTTAAVDTTASESSAEGNLAGFMKDVGAELNDFWAANWGDGWKTAVVKVPEDGAQTACGTIDAANSGPAYCGDDNTMVLPVAFFRDKLVSADDNLSNDAAVAAVIGHEFGHHLQTIGGLGEAVSAAQADNPEAANLLSVANELHADCLMGLWMSSVDDEKRLEPGDLDEVLTTLEKIGDDKLSADAGVEADASTFDHGTAEQRQTWFGVGFETKDPEACSKVFDDMNDGTLEQELQAGADSANGGAATDTTG